MAVDYEKLGVFYLGKEFDARSNRVQDDLVLYDSRDLTTHAVCVGMTGSGKTGLCLSLLEEAAIDGVPAVCIDPKGDLGNLLLAFPDLAAENFQPWMDPADAERKGVSVEQLAQRTADSWRQGLADWQQAPERIARFRDAVDVAIYTPGADTGLPLSVLRSFAPPPPEQLTDGAALRDRIGAVVAGLLSLLGIDADPLTSREHILLASIIESSWRAGISLDMAALINAVQKPGFDRVGAFDLETFYPGKERLKLAMQINNLLAAPGFATWLSGEPLDAQRLLFTPTGKPRISIISIAHLSDSERMFVVTLVLNEMIAWMRTQSGTSSLRALLYMDEIFGYFPPTANPPSKLPMLTLLKQARAFGLGCVLATQNPVDLDYKGLANCGTWLIGRLQTERDKLRVLEGLESALADAAFDRATLDRMISGLTQRVFLLRNVHEDAPLLLQSRWALSYLRGPLTGNEIKRLMASRKSANDVASATVTATSAAAQTEATLDASPTAAAPAARPSVAGDVVECFLPPTTGSGPVTYQPMILAQAKLHFIDGKLDLDHWSTNDYLAPLSDDGKQALWAEGVAGTGLKARTTATAADGAARYTELPAAAMRAAAYKDYGKQLAASLYENQRARVWVADSLKVVSLPGESEGDFRARLAHTTREMRDSAVDDLRQKYAQRIQRLQDQVRRAEDKHAREKSQLSSQRLQTAVSIGSTILGALFGRKAVSATSVGRAATAINKAKRVGSEQQDVAQAEEGLEVVQQRLAAMQRECETEIEALTRRLDPSTIELRSVEVTPRKSDIAIGDVALAWTPWRRGADGFPARAFEA
ncbi:MAG TPA: hypothetical protein PK159_07365 [Steroidobacteraceae bacterium]|nr:hypothetical protein [Steroidobacteraceae bacterium]